MTRLRNSSYGYQIMEKPRHTITKYLNDKKIHKAINEPFSRKLKTVENDLYEVELLKSIIAHREPISVGFSYLSMRS